MQVVTSLLFCAGSVCLFHPSKWQAKCAESASKSKVEFGLLLLRVLGEVTGTSSECQPDMESAAVEVCHVQV